MFRGARAGFDSPKDPRGSLPSLSRGGVSHSKAVYSSKSMGWTVYVYILLHGRCFREKRHVFHGQLAAVVAHQELSLFVEAKIVY